MNSEAVVSSGLPEISLHAQVERKKLDVIAQPFEAILGPIHHTMVGDEGVVVSFDRIKPIAGGNWLMFDLDETVFQYTQAKTERLTKFREYLAERGLVGISKEQSEKLMELTNKFSRWEDKLGKGKNYHVEAHMTALSWATQQLARAKRVTTERGEAADYKDVIENVEMTLSRIALNSYNLDGKPVDTDPFYIRNGKFVLREKTTWTRGNSSIDSVFKETIFKPFVFEEIIQVMKKLGSPLDSIHRYNIGFFTKGKFGFQEYKALELLQEYPDLPISQIWITQANKGDFIVSAVETGAMREPEMAYVPVELEEYPGDSPAYGSGYPLGMMPHVIVQFDDDPKQLDDILSKNDYLSLHSEAEVVCVRSIQANTKTQEKTWEVSNPYGVVDFTVRHYAPQHVATLLQLNLYLKLKEKRGENNEYVMNLKQKLEIAGVIGL